MKAPNPKRAIDNFIKNATNLRGEVEYTRITFLIVKKRNDRTKKLEHAIV